MIVDRPSHIKGQIWLLVHNFLVVGISNLEVTLNVGLINGVVHAESLIMVCSVYMIAS